MNIEATMAIRSLKRIMQNGINYQTNLGKQVLLLPSDVDIVIDDNQQVETKGLGALDNKKKDLLTHIRIIEPLHLIYENTNVIMPRTYRLARPRSVAASSMFSTRQDTLSAPISPSSEVDTTIRTGAPCRGSAFSSPVALTASARTCSST